MSKEEQIAARVDCQVRLYRVVNDCYGDSSDFVVDAYFFELNSKDFWFHTSHNSKFQL